MGRKQQQYTLNVEQNSGEQVKENSCSLWKIFVMCLLACLVATAITALAFYFGRFGNPTNTTIIIRTDGGSSQDSCTTASTPSLTSSPAPGPETTPSSTTITTPDSTPSPPTPTTEMADTTIEHEVEIEYDYTVV